MSRFKVGDKVRWVAQYVSRIGTIIEVVEPGTSPTTFKTSGRATRIPVSYIIDDVYESGWSESYHAYGHCVPKKRKFWPQTRLVCRIGEDKDDIWDKRKVIPQ